MQAINARTVADERHARRWQDAVALAQVDVGVALARAIAQGRFGREGYQDWLAMESVACRIGALSLDAVAGWHGPQPALQATAQAWAAALRGQAQAAARDVRVLDGMAATPPPALAQWHAFVGSAASSQRAGEVLGAVLLHAGLFEGPVRAVAAAISAMPFSRGGQYLSSRLREDGAPLPAERERLLDAYSATALAVGALRAAGWYHAALVDVLAPRAG